MAHPDTPTLASLEIHSGVFGWARKGMRSLNHLPNDRLPRSLWVALRGGYHSEVQHWNFCSTFSPATPRPSQCSLFYWSHHPHNHSQDRIFEIGYRSGSKFSGHTQKCEQSSVRSPIIYTERQSPHPSHHRMHCYPQKRTIRLSSIPRLESIALQAYTNTIQLGPPVSCLRHRRSAGSKHKHKICTDRF